MTKRYNILTRCLAAVALFFVYIAGTSAILVGATTTAVVISVESGPNATLPTSTGVVYQLLTERPRMW